MRELKTTCSVLTALACALAASVATAADYYISPTGTATWAQCTNINTPCSWQTAMANAVADDVVFFRGGTYDVGLIGPQRDYANMHPASSGTPGHPITFRAYPNERPTVTATVDVNSTAAYFGCSYSDHVVWDGFAATLQLYSGATGNAETQTWGSWGSDYCTIRNGDFTGVNVAGRPYNTSFVRVEGSSYTTVENNYFHDLTDVNSVGAVAVNTAAVWLFISSNTVIRNNTMENCRGGVYGKVAPTLASVHHNFIYDTSGTCFRGVNFNCTIAGACTGHNVYQNVIVGCETGMQAVTTSAASAFRYYNNTIYSNNDNHNGIYAGGALTGAEFFNNVIAGKSPYERFALATVAYADNNIFYNSGSNVWSVEWSTNYTTLSAWTAATGFDANSFVEDPLFANPGGSRPEDYKIASAHRNSGRGGSYPTVIGAYITGDEVIGYSSTYLPDSLAPAAPSNLTVQ